MFIWDFVADTVLSNIIDWLFAQIVGFLGDFFARMGMMGVELFELSWVQSIVLFFSRLGWALFAASVVVCAFECGIEYSSGRGNIRQTILNVLKGFMAVASLRSCPSGSTPCPLRCREPSRTESPARGPASLPLDRRFSTTSPVTTCSRIWWITTSSAQVSSRAPL